MVAATRNRQSLCSDQTAHKFFRRRLRVAEGEGLRDALARFVEFCGGIVMDCDEEVAPFDAVTDTFVEFESYAVVDFVFFFFTAAAEHGEGDAEFHAVGSGEES